MDKDGSSNYMIQGSEKKKIELEENYTGCHKYIPVERDGLRG
jgi:hypothetical protein